MLVHRYRLPVSINSLRLWRSPPAISSIVRPRCSYRGEHSDRRRRRGSRPHVLGRLRCNGDFRLACASRAMPCTLRRAVAQALFLKLFNANR